MPPASPQGPLRSTRRRIKTFFQAEGITMRVNQLGVRACSHDGLELSAFNQWGVNAREVAVDCRWAGEVSQQTQPELMIPKIRSALSATGF
jgi:hypothetical protein